MLLKIWSCSPLASWHLASIQAIPFTIPPEAVDLIQGKKRRGHREARGRGEREER